MCSLCATGQRTDQSARISRSLFSLLLAGTFLCGFTPSMVSSVKAQDATGAQEAVRQLNFSIPAKPLKNALDDFIRATGWQISYSTNAIRNKTSNAIKGRMSAEEALQRLVSSTSVVVIIRAPGAAALVSAADMSETESSEDTVLLETLSVNSGAVGWDGSEEEVYSTPGAVSFISRGDIENYRGTNVADILKSEAGVMSGSSRNSGGLDVNIRGLQGQGRVPVTVDGTQNATSVYNGYQGIGNRSFIDPAFIGGISIEQGPSTGANGSGAIGGMVSMRTVNPDDIVKPGEQFGVRTKLGLGTNTTELSDKTKKNKGSSATVGMDRPATFAANSGSASIVMASKGERIDLLAGYARRKTGNYHAGTNNSGTLDLPFQPGEEVLNTSQNTKSGLLKGVFRLGEDDEHRLELAYSKYSTEYGENYTYDVRNSSATINQRALSYTDLDRYSANYKWNPDSNLIDFKTNIWKTSLTEAAASSSGLGTPKLTKTVGFDISNTSRFDGAFGALSVEYGGAMLSEETGSLTGSWSSIPGRTGARFEKSAFSRADYSPWDWLTFNGGFRLQDFKVRGDLGPALGSYAPPTQRNSNAFGYSAGITVEPLEGLQFFGSYKRAARLPSLMEGTPGFLLVTAPDLKEETAFTWEAGANFTKTGLLSEEDRVGLKVTYFHNDVSDYIARDYNLPSHPYRLYMYNISEAKFEGINASAQYTNGSFKAEASASYYTHVRYCQTAGNCVGSSLAEDYGTNQIPPKFSASVALSKGFFDNRFTLGGRLTYVGKRAAQAQKPASGASALISAVPWEPYTVFDLYGSYQVTNNTKLDLRVENLTDRYYIDPLNMGRLPAPGRTVWLELSSEFSPGTHASTGDGLAFLDRFRKAENFNWTGLYAGGFGGLADGNADTDNHVSKVGPNLSTSEKQFGDFDGRTAGIRAGYNYQFPNGLVIGAEADHNFVPIEHNASVSADYLDSISLESLTTARLKAGVAFGRFMAYGTGGFAMGNVSFGEARKDYYDLEDTKRAKGWVLGGGLEWALTDNLSLNAEYMTTVLETDRFEMSGVRTGHTDKIDIKTRLDMDLDIMRVGMNLRF